MSTQADSDQAQLQLGVMLWPDLGTAYPDLKQNLAQLYQARVVNIPWLPPGWLDAVSIMQRNNPRDIVVVAPSNGRAGTPNQFAPPWQNAEQRKAWTDFSLVAMKAVGDYARQDQEAGQARLDALIANAAFWDRAYKIAVAVRDAVPNAVNGLVTNFWAGLGTKWKIIGAVVLVGAGLYFAMPFIKGAKALKGLAK